MVCPFAYLASRRIEALAQRVGATVDWRPVLLGGVYRAVGQADYPSAIGPPEKLRMNALDLHRWAALDGVPLRVPAGHPRRSVEAMRLVVSVSGDERRAVSRALYEAYWVDGADVADVAVLARVVRDKVGWPEERTRGVLADAGVKAALHEATAEAVARGVFGVPTFVVEETGELVWGQDRMAVLEGMLARADRKEQQATGDRQQATGNGGWTEEAGGGARAELDFWFDPSSPYAYLAATQLAGLQARTGAPVRWRPLFLGARFKQLGYPADPLQRYPAVKSEYLKRDFARAARHLGIALVMPKTFPQSSLQALRMLVAAEARGGQPDMVRLALAIYDAYWSGGDLDLADLAALARVADAAGLPGAALADQAQTPAVKQALVALTEEAAAAEIFGAPFFRVTHPGGATDWFWGHDRLPLVERALAGWRPDLASVDLSRGL